MKRILSIHLLQVSVLILFITMIRTLSVLAQSTSDKRDDLFDSKQDLKSLIQAPVVGVPPLEGPVDPNTYLLGPSDLLSINIWTSPPLNFSLIVTPEGSLIIPTVGEVSLLDLTLAEAKSKIISEIKRKYILGRPSVTLQRPRDFMVTITGNVRFPGKYKMNATERVDMLIQTANSVLQRNPGETSLTSGMNKIEENPNYKPENSSKRNILLHCRNGSSSRVDLQKFLVTNNNAYDPFLLEGDEVFVPILDNSKNLFAVYGAVNAPGRYEFINGDSLLDGIKLAFGFIDRANLDSIEHIRLNPASGELISTTVKATDLFQGSRKNLPLEPGDRIIVKERVDLREDYRVFVHGEVLHPGIYPITKNSTRLSEIIREAGGLTENASLKSAELNRTVVIVDDAQLDRMIRQKSNITPEDNMYVTVEGDTRIRRNNINIDFEKLFLGKDESQDIILKSEDHIYIPSISKTVFVFGQVAVPGNIPFIEGKDVKYYIGRAGGFTDDAQKGDVAVIKWITREWLDPDKTQIQEGDFIWVPPIVRRPASYWLAIIGQTTSIVSVALSIVILVIQLKK